MQYGDWGRETERNERKKQNTPMRINGRHNEYITVNGSVSKAN